MSRKRRLLQRYLAEEIRIDFKACLYFFCMVFFYSVYRIWHGSWEASIIHMAEMISTNYLMGYVQVYLLDNFDEADRFRGKEMIKTVTCSLVYVLVSWICGWFDRGIIVTLIYWGYMILCFICTFLSYKVKRDIDSKSLMADLQKYKEGNRVHGEGD